MRRELPFEERWDIGRIHPGASLLRGTFDHKSGALRQHPLLDGSLAPRGPHDRHRAGSVIGVIGALHQDFTGRLDTTFGAVIRREAKRESVRAPH
jgi:hypothetical protein